MADELKELPRSWLERKLGELGVGLSTVGRSMAEGAAPLAEKYPVRHWLSENLLTSPLQSAGAALQDYTATPRDITPEYPYRARLFDPRQPAMIDPRTLDLAQFAAPVAGRVRNAARFALPDLKAAAIAAYGPDVSAAHVVKPKGGNWVPGDVEGSMTTLKSALVPDYERYPGPNVTDEAKAQANALRSWVDTKLTRYLKNELATPEDPVRALAERNISHLQTEYEGVNVPAPRIMLRRIAAGQNWRGAGTSPLAKQWDYRADLVVDPTDARSLSALERDQLFGNKRVPPETVVHQISASPITELELGHLTDELRNALNPASGLPRNLQLTPEQLSKVTVPQAVERVAKINAWRAAQKAEATAAGANNPATVLHKEYPTIPGTDTLNERGLRWVELKAPKVTELPKGYEVRPVERENGTWYAVYGPDNRSTGGVGRTAQEAIENENFGHKTLGDALKYEGDAMGHCVGGYCADVASGRTRIYSLRDVKGQPHVTIEVRPTQHLDYNKWFENQPEEIQNRIAQRRIEDKNHDIYEGPEYLAARAELPPTIIQIKGKGNRKPNDEYLPFVQDFVRSNQWNSVGDLQNTGMRATKSVFSDTELAQLREAGETDIPHILTGAEIQKLHNLIVPEGKRLKYDATGNIIGDEAGYAEGGAVEYNPSKVDDIISSLRAEMTAPGGYAHGGPVEYDPNKVDELVRQLREEMYG
jgi:hypothetical protein